MPLHEEVQTLLEEIEAEQASILEQIAAMESDHADVSNLSSIRQSFLGESTRSSSMRAPSHDYDSPLRESVRREDRTQSQSQYSEQLSPDPSPCRLAAEVRALTLSHSHLLEQNQRLMKSEDKLMESIAELMKQVLQLTKDLQEIKLQQANALNQAPVTPAPSTPANQSTTGTPSPAPQATSSPQLPQQSPQHPQQLTHQLASRQTASPSIQQTPRSIYQPSPAYHPLEPAPYYQHHMIPPSPMGAGAQAWYPSPYGVPSPMPNTAYYAQQGYAMPAYDRAAVHPSMMASTPHSNGRDPLQSLYEMYSSIGASPEEKGSAEQMASLQSLKASSATAALNQRLLVSGAAGAACIQGTSLQKPGAEMEEKGRGSGTPTSAEKPTMFKGGSITSGLPSKSLGVVPPAMFSPGAPSPSATARPTPAAPAQLPSRGFISTPDRGIKNITPPMSLGVVPPAMFSPGAPSPSVTARPTPAAPAQVPSRGIKNITLPMSATGPCSFAGTPTKPLGSVESKVSPKSQGMVKQETADRQRLTMMASSAGSSPSMTAQPKTRQQFTGASSVTLKPSQVFGQFSSSHNTVKPAASFGIPATTTQSPFTGFSFGIPNASTPSTSTISAAGVFKPAISSKTTLQPTTGGATGVSPMAFGKPDLTQDSRSSLPSYPGFYASPKALPGASSQADQSVPSSRKPGQSPLGSVESKVSPKPQGIVKQETADRQRLTMMAFSAGSSPSVTVQPKTQQFTGASSVTSKPSPAFGQFSFSPYTVKPAPSFGKPATTTQSPFAGFSFGMPNVSTPSTSTIFAAGIFKPAVSSKTTLEPTTGGATGVSPMAFGKPDLTQDSRSSLPSYPGFYASPKALPGASSQADQSVPSSRKPGQSPRGSVESKVSPKPQGIVKQGTADRHRLTMNPFSAGSSPSVTVQPKTQQFTGASSVTSKPSQVFGQFSFSPYTVKPAASFGKPATTTQSPFAGFSFGMPNASTPSTSTISAAGVFKPAVSSKTTLQPAAGGATGVSPVTFGKPDLTQDSRSSSPSYPGFYASPKALPGASPQADQIVPSSRKPGQSPMAKDTASTKAVDTPKSVSFKAEVEDDDVIFISITQPSPERCARAAKLQLPPGFYLYEDAPPCKGCIGCIEDLDLDSLYRTGGDGKASAPVVRPKEPISSLGATGGGSLSISAPGGSLFGGGDTGGGISFASLAANQSEGFGQPFGKKASDKPFSFANAGAPVFGATASHDNEDNDESHGGDEEYDPHYEPIVTLPDIGSISTGEEDEEEMFRHRAKLFRYDRDSKAWKERGVGDIKILRNPKTGGARILMRRDQILKLCANHSITPDMVLKPMMAPETAWVWFAVDFSEEEAKNEQLAVKFKHVEDAKRFKEAFLEAQELLQVKEGDKKDQEKEVEKKKEEKEIKQINWR